MADYEFHLSAELKKGFWELKIASNWISFLPLKWGMKNEVKKCSLGLCAISYELTSAPFARSEDQEPGKIVFDDHASALVVGQMKLTRMRKSLSRPSR